ncbi:MAG TPA: hypothetical protein VGO97_01455 [Solirubrobacterales bacterium]|jgi:hypothetical protein|nr:hypothetical protein [Solirubrobacterales bacterium]
MERDPNLSNDSESDGSTISDDDGGTAARKPRRRAGTLDRSALAWMIGPVVAFAVLVALILNTGTPKPGALMKDAADSFGKVKRGVFAFEITVTPRGSTTTTDPSTIRLTGPFELVPGKKLPKARINYTVTAGGRSQNLSLLTTGDRAYTIVGDQAYSLPAAATKSLEAATKDLSKPGKSPGLSGLNFHFDKWLIKPEVGTGAEIDGTPTWQTRAAVDVVAAIRDLTGSARTLGAITGSTLPLNLKESDIKELRKSIKDAKVTVFVGRYDRIVRKIDLSMDFVTPVSLRAAAGGVSSSRLNVIIAISKPNEPVNVQPPKDPLPYRALQSLSQSSNQQGTALDDGLGR